MRELRVREQEIPSTRDAIIKLMKKHQTFIKSHKISSKIQKKNQILSKIIVKHKILSTIHEKSSNSMQNQKMLSDNS